MAVLNKHHYRGVVPVAAVNIMRETRFGNPFPIIEGMVTREQSIDAYKKWLWKAINTSPDFADAVRNLHGRDLCCCCAPLACHGDVLQAAAKWLHDNQRMVKLC